MRRQGAELCLASIPNREKHVDRRPEGREAQALTRVGPHTRGAGWGMEEKPGGQARGVQSASNAKLVSQNSLLQAWRVADVSRSKE